METSARGDGAWELRVRSVLSLSGQTPQRGRTMNVDRPSNGSRRMVYKDGRTKRSFEPPFIGIGEKIRRLIVIRRVIVLQ